MSDGARVSDTFALDSVLELPISRSTRVLRILLFAALNIALAGSGIFMIVTYANNRSKSPTIEVEHVGDAGKGEVPAQIEDGLR